MPFQCKELLASEIPKARSSDGKVHVSVIAGKCLGVESPVFTETPSLYWDVHLKPNATFEEKIPNGYNAFIYVLNGHVLVGDKQSDGPRAACLVLGAGESVKVTTKDDARFVVLAGQPLNEPVVQHGPFVMNTREQIMEAFQDYSAGKF